MENIKAIKFDLGGLPVKDPDEFELLGMPEEIFPGQFLYTKKEHRRTLDVLLLKSENKLASLFLLKNSFPYYMPEIDGNNLEDEMMKPAYIIYEGEIFYGRLPDKKKQIILYGPQKYYEFYSMDKNLGIHKTTINLKYIPSKDMVKFIVSYDDKIKLKLDTTGNYSMKNIISKHVAKLKGNLLSEKDFTLYLDKEIPIKIYAETFDK